MQRRMMINGFARLLAEMKAEANGTDSSSPARVHGTGSQ